MKSSEMNRNDHTMLPDGSIEVMLTKGYTAIIDAVDIDILDDYTWHVSFINGRPFAATLVSKKFLLLHRIIMDRIGNPADDPVAHANGNTLDNRRDNLTITSRYEIQKNTRIRHDNTSGMKGVFYSKKKRRWIGAIQRQGISRRKQFTTFDAACLWRIEQEQEFNGSE